jgi:hypothetical protein
MDKVEADPDTGLVEQLACQPFRFVGRTTQCQAMLTECAQCFRNAGIESARDEKVVAVTMLESAKCFLEQRVNGWGVKLCCQCAPYEYFYTIADPAARIRKTRAAEADRVERMTQAMGKIRRGVDERAVEIERYQSV